MFVLFINSCVSLWFVFVFRCLWRRWRGNSRMLTKWQRPTKERQLSLPAAWLRREELVCQPVFNFSWTNIIISLFMTIHTVHITHTITFAENSRLTVSVHHLQANNSIISSSSSRQPCRFLEETHGSTSSVPGGSKFGCWLSTANANSMMLWTGWRR